MNTALMILLALFATVFLMVFVWVAAIAVTDWRKADLNDRFFLSSLVTLTFLGTAGTIIGIWAVATYGGVS